MYDPSIKRITFDTTEELKCKLKGYAAMANIPLAKFLNRTLAEKVKRIEKGMDEFIKIEKKEKK